MASAASECLVCKDAVTTHTNGVACEVCEEWAHLICLGFKEVPKMLTHKNFLFMCDACLRATREARKTKKNTCQKDQSVQTEEKEERQEKKDKDVQTEPTKNALPAPPARRWL